MLPLLLHKACVNIISTPVYALPFFLLPTLLQRARARSLTTIVAIFSLGALCVICSMIRVACIGKATTLPLFGAMGAIDLGTGICVCCCPIIKQGLDIRLHEHTASCVARTPGSGPSGNKAEKRPSKSNLRSRQQSKSRTASSRIIGAITGTILRQTNSRGARDGVLEHGDAIGLNSTMELDRTAILSNLEDEADDLESGVGFGTNRQVGPSGGLAPRIRRTESANTVSNHLQVSNTREFDNESDANASNSTEVITMEGSPAAQSLLRPPSSPAKVKKGKMKIFGTSTFGSNSTFGSTNRSFAGNSQLDSLPGR